MGRSDKMGLGILGDRVGIPGGAQLQWADGVYSSSTGIISDPGPSYGWRKSFSKCEQLCQYRSVYEWL